MVDHIDIQYANLSASRTERFALKSAKPFRANFRCPFCLDSKKSKTIARGWLQESNDKIGFHCFNCGKSASLSSFLKELDPSLYNEYITSRFVARGGKKERSKSLSNNYRPSGVHGSSGNSVILSYKKEMESDIYVAEDEHLQKIRKISELSEDHPARKYVAEDRLIPSKHFDKLYYVGKFKKWVNSIIDNKFPDSSLSRDEPRLVIPFREPNGKMFGFTGRSFDPDPDTLRYISIMIDGDKDKFYGLDNVDFTKQYFVLEGGIDSLFIDNACAMAGSDGNFSSLKNKENCVVVYDNEPRNIEIHKKIARTIDDGYSVVIWPKSIEFKDVNEMVQMGYGVEEINDILKSRIFSGMEAAIELNKWKQTEKVKKKIEDTEHSSGFEILTRKRVQW